MNNKTKNKISTVFGSLFRPWAVPPSLVATELLKSLSVWTGPSPVAGSLCRSERHAYLASNIRLRGRPERLRSLGTAEQRSKAQLVDVRTTAEWNFVGLPDLSGLGREPHLVEWQMFPTMQPNPAFVPTTAAAVGADKDAPVLFLCRSGARSRAAAIALTRAGYSRAYNIAGGFEGDLDGERHRGHSNGWKATGLPWKQT